MRCREQFERISKYLDGELGTEECQELERHLAECPGCLDCLESIRKTIKICKQMGNENLPPDTAFRLRQKVLACLSAQQVGHTSRAPRKGGVRGKFTPKRLPKKETEGAV